MIHLTPGEHANHYTTNAVLNSGVKIFYRLYLAHIFHNELMENTYTDYYFLKRLNISINLRNIRLNIHTLN